MNLMEFLRKVDERLDSMSYEELRQYVRETARTLGEGEREGFLCSLSCAESNPHKTTSDADEIYSDTVKHYKAEVGQILQKLDDLDKGEKFLSSCFNEEYDEWSNSDADEYYFQDKDHILDSVDRACILIEKCNDAEEYNSSYKLVEALENLEVYVTGDYADCEDGVLAIDELDSYHLLEMDWEKVATDGIYAAYRATSMNERASVVFSLIRYSRCGFINLENIMQAGKHELPDLDQFLPEWVSYLSGIIKERPDDPNRNSYGPSYYAAKLIEEAGIMSRQSNDQISIAMKCGREIPKLYLDILNRLVKDNDYEKASEISEYALKDLKDRDNDNGFHEAIAKTATEIFEHIHNYKKAGETRMETFQISPSSGNYLSLCLKTGDFDAAYRRKTEDIYRKLIDDYVKSNAIYDKQHDVFATALLDGDFETALDVGLNKEEALGWSMSFMKQGIALFLISCYKDGPDGEPLPREIQNMISAANVYGFKELYYDWKRLRPIPEDIKKRAITKINILLQKRTAAILGNYRNYYGECANFIAALGKVRESNGEINAEREALVAYHQQFRRYNAFTKELRRFTNSF
ncbi:MAG: hypothetical protein WCQ94_09125 [Lachnospiraceae bacterium]